MKGVAFRIPDIRLDTIKEYARKVKERYHYYNYDYIQNLTQKGYESDIPSENHQGNYLIVYCEYLYWAWDPDHWFGEVGEDEGYNIIDLCGDGFIGRL